MGRPAAGQTGAVTTSDLGDLELPPGARLIHIGPAKTGTTSVQAAMWAHRADLRQQGVRYAGRGRHSASATRSLIGRGSVFGEDGSPPPVRTWERLAREIRTADEPRVVLSSEFLSHAKDDTIRRIVDDIDLARIHVAVTLRPVPRMLSSLWQQGVQVGGIVGFEDWLLERLGRDGAIPDHPLWRTQRHDRLIERWAGVVGRDRVTAIVVDQNDHAWVLRAFEALLGIRSGTLQLQVDYQNRSLMLDEAEAIRSLNQRLRDLGVSRGDHTYLVRHGGARAMKLRQPGASERRVATPMWAHERACIVGEAAVAGIRASGVRVVGELDRLLVDPDAVDPLPPWDGRLPADAAVAMAIGTVTGTGLLQAAGYRGDAGTTREFDRDAVLAILSDRELLKLLIRRQLHRVRRTARSLGGSSRD